MSLPTRGEWVEILYNSKDNRKKEVSPHTGRVGWNKAVKKSALFAYVSPHTGRVGWNSGAGGMDYGICGLSPHGESGLKFLDVCATSQNTKVSPHTGRVGWNRSTGYIFFAGSKVSPHTGRVGWNQWSGIVEPYHGGLSPHGESGLKSASRFQFDWPC